MYNIHYLVPTASGGVSEKQLTVKGYQELHDLIGRIKQAGYEIVMNSMCKGCQRFLNGCDGEINHVYSGCIYK